MMCRLPLKKYESMINYLNLAEKDKNQTKSFASSSSEEVEPEEKQPSIDSLPSELPDEDGEEEYEDKQKKMFQNKLISGLWGLHRFEKNPWSAKVRPFRRLKHFESLKLGALEKKGKLTKRMIGCCLSYLERSPYDLKYALCKCQLAEKAIINISELRSYHYIQYLDLSHNKITTLEPLSEMPFLQYLNVSHNYIEIPFDFKAPLYLTTVNYSHNRIVKIVNLSAFWSITSLDMSFNCIREIKGLESLKYLSDLNLAHNRIMMLENLSNLRIIRLNLSCNRISVIENEESGIGFSTLNQLTSVDFSFNKFTSLKFLHKNEDLEELNITNNNINDLLEIYYLRHMAYLNRLNIADNLLCENAHFKALCIRTLPKLRLLNGQPISPEDRIEAATKEYVSKFFPAHSSRMRLLLLEQLNRPKIGAHVCPYGESIPSLIVIVGPPASKKKLFASKFVEHSDFLKLGISHTTRPKKKCEIDGKDFYYTKYDHFVRMVRQADFLTVTEFNGHLYGIAHSELEKAINCILVFYSDLETGLILKMAGLNAKLVLAMPQDEKNHIKWLKDSYFFDENNTTTLPEITIKTCPTVLKDVDKAQEELDKDGDLFIIDDDDRSFEIEDFSSTLIDSKIFKQCRSSFGDEPLAKVIDVYNNTQLAMSEKNIDECFYAELPQLQVEENLSKSEHRSSLQRHEKKIMSWKNYAESAIDYVESRELTTAGPEYEGFSNRNNTPNIVELKVESGPLAAAWKKLDSELPCSDADPTCKLAKYEPNYHLGAKDKLEEPNPESAEDGSLSGILKKDVQDGVSEPSEVIGAQKKSNSWQAGDSSSSLGDAVSGGSYGMQADKSKGSNQEDSLTRERSSSNKRVSFTYGRLHEDEISYDPNFFDSTEREHIKSVSNTHILRSMQNRFFDNPLLSVLSASELVDEQDDEGRAQESTNLGVQAKTAYMTLAERFDALKTDKLGPYLARVMLLRKELLELHFENPGLFQAIIFTDGDPNKCIEILKEITKHLVETSSLSIRHDPDKDSEEYKNYVNRKFEELKIFDFRYTRLYEDIFSV